LSSTGKSNYRSTDERRILSVVQRGNIFSPNVRR
jgi:hypothetical protein